MSTFIEIEDRDGNFHILNRNHIIKFRETTDKPGTTFFLTGDMRLGTRMTIEDVKRAMKISKSK